MCATSFSTNKNKDALEALRECIPKYIPERTLRLWAQRYRKISRWQAPLRATDLANLTSALCASSNLPNLADFLPRNLKSSTELFGNSSEVSFHSSEVSFHSSEVSFHSSELLFHSSEEIEVLHRAIGKFLRGDWDLQAQDVSASDSVPWSLSDGIGYHS